MMLAQQSHVEQRMASLLIGGSIAKMLYPHSQ